MSLHFGGRGGSQQTPGGGEGQRPPRKGRGGGQARNSQRSGQRPPNAAGRDSHATHSTPCGGQSPAEREYSGRAETPLHNYEAGGKDLLGVAAEHLEARDLSNAIKVLIKLSKLEHARGARDDPKLRDVLSRLYGQFRSQDITIWPRELADVAFALGKLQLNDPLVVELLKKIAEIAKYQADKFTPHDMAGLVWGFASLGVRNESLMSVIAAEVVNKVDGFDHRQLSNTAWAFAKCGLWNEQLVSAIAAECLAKITTFTAQSLSHISWAMAQWGTRKEDLMNAIADELQRKTSEFGPAPLAMTVWSFASLQLKNICLMSCVSNEAVGKITHFKTQDLAHLAWAFANLRIQDQLLFNTMAEEIQKNIKGTLPPELANIAWAFSKNSFTHESLMNAIACEAVLQIRSFKSAEVAMLTWAFAGAGLQNKQLMTEVGAQVAKRIDKFSAPQLSHIAWAFGALSLRHTEFLQSLSAHIHGSISAFKAQGLSNIVWAFAMVTFRDEHLLRRVAPEIARDVAELRPLALARCAWAYRVLAIQSPELMNAVSLEALKKVDDFPTKALVKLTDSVYISPTAIGHTLLEKALAARTIEVSAFFKSTWKLSERPPSATAEDYGAHLANFGILDCGIVGTPLLLAQLEIELPSRSFIQRCRTQAWKKCSQEGQRNHPENARHRDFTVAEIDVKAMDKKLHDWVVRYPNDTGQDRECSPSEACLPVDGRHEEVARWLVAVDLPGQNGRDATTYLVLEDVCVRIFNLGVAPGAAVACAAIEGSVQVLSTVLPCLSSVGVLHQFKMLFPNVVLEFADQVGTIRDR